jgi:hypothetical protein
MSPIAIGRCMNIICKGKYLSSVDLHCFLVAGLVSSKDSIRFLFNYSKIRRKRFKNLHVYWFINEIKTTDISSKKQLITTYNKYWILLRQIHQYRSIILFTVNPVNPVNTCQSFCWEINICLINCLKKPLYVIMHRERYDERYSIFIK